MSDSQESIAKARVGTTLCGKWLLERLIGVGGMASVYAASHRNNLKAVAVKVLHSDLCANPEIKRRFLREGYLANKVGHPNVVSVLDDDVDEDGTVFLVMELFEGETLYQRYHGGGTPLTMAEVLDIGDQILDVLTTAHAEGIVHRDLKPDNIFLTREGQAKVLDFGIARVMETDGSTKTQVGIILGTPSYMAPEQARGRSEHIDGRTDLWAVGAILFALLSGKRVHEAKTLHEQLALAMNEPAPPLAAVMTGVPTAVAEVIDKALAFDPAQRWQDAASMREALRKAKVALESDPGWQATLYAPAPGLPSLTPSRLGSQKQKTPRKLIRRALWVLVPLAALGTAFALRGPLERAFEQTAGKLSPAGNEAPDAATDASAHPPRAATRAAANLTGDAGLVGSVDPSGGQAPPEPADSGSDLPPATMGAEPEPGVGDPSADTQPETDLLELIRSGALSAPSANGKRSVSRPRKTHRMRRHVVIRRRIIFRKRRR